MTDDRFREVFNLLERRVEDRWGIPVRINDVKTPFTGDLDGAEIQIDHDLTAEDALFILVHLFGHTVQWNISEELRAMNEVRGPHVPPEIMTKLIAYERQACEYSLQLMHEAGVHDLDQWLADFSACDLAYLVHFYDTGTKAPFRSFWKPDAPPVTPRPIPEFHPTKWLWRWDGVVV
jgi:hypothetical protein